MTIVTRRNCLMFGLSAACLAASPARAAENANEAILSILRRSRIPGAAVAVLRSGRVEKEIVFGAANVELGVPVTRTTSFHLASMSKEFAAVGAASLAEKGALSFDDPVSKYVADLPDAWSKVTLRHVLTHTSGLPDVVTDDLNLFVLAGTWQDALPKLAALPTEEPGRRTRYNQTGYALAGLAIERVTGRPFTDFVLNQLLRPAGITGASYGDSWSIIAGRAELYTAVEPTPDHSRLAAINGRPVVAKDSIYRLGLKAFPGFLHPAGGLNMSIADLVKWERALESGKVISKESLRGMTEQFLLADGKPGDFAMAFLRGETDGLRTLSTGGGAAVWCLRVPDRGLTVILLTNLQGSFPEKVAAEIARKFI